MVVLPVLRESTHEVGDLNGLEHSEHVQGIFLLEAIRLPVNFSCGAIRAARAEALVVPAWYGTTIRSTETPFIANQCPGFGPGVNPAARMSPPISGASASSWVLTARSASVVIKAR